MYLWLIFLILVLPTLELYVLLHMGGLFGALPTILLVVATAVFGVRLMRNQGLGILLRIHGALERKETPTLELMEGAMVLLGGLLLLIPGFVTDAIGFMILIPPIRYWLLKAFIGRVPTVQPYAESAARHKTPRVSQVIEGEFQRESKPRSPWDQP